MGKGEQIEMEEEISVMTEIGETVCGSNKLYKETSLSV